MKQYQSLVTGKKIQCNIIQCNINVINSTGELKLAQRQISMVELSAIIDSIDKNGDGKLTYEEVKAVLKQVGGKVFYKNIILLLFDQIL